VTGRDAVPRASGQRLRSAAFRDLLLESAVEEWARPLPEKDTSQSALHMYLYIYIYIYIYKCSRSGRQGLAGAP